MEKVNKDEIYYVEHGNFWMIGLVINPDNEKSDSENCKGDATFINSNKGFNINSCWCYHALNRTNRLASEKEQHWLRECIRLNKYIEKDEAMKTFIPEYVECIKLPNTDNLHLYSGTKVGKIYKVDNWNYHGSCCTLIGETNSPSDRKRFKPSTKEAYDTQTELEIWLEKTKALNLSLNDLTKYIKNPKTCHLKIYMKLEGRGVTGKTKILFDKWNKNIEPLPQFRIVEFINTITKVENGEGNQFFMGDVITPVEGVNKGKKFVISGFRYNKTKTNICAITKTHSPNGIGIDKIEHYIEPKVEVEDNFILPEKWFIKPTDETFDIIKNWANKMQFKLYDDYKYHNMVTFNDKGEYRRTINCTEITFDQFKKYVLKEEVKEETLLEKAKRLYPVGTKIYSAHFPEMKYKSIVEGYKESNGVVYCLNKNGGGSCHIYINNRWAEIINSHDFKIGDRIKSRYSNDIWRIIKIEGDVLFYDEISFINKNHSRILAKNAIKVN